MEMRKRLATVAVIVVAALVAVGVSGSADARRRPKKTSFGDCVGLLAGALDMIAAMDALNSAAWEEWTANGGSVSEERQDTYEDMAGDITSSYNQIAGAWEKGDCGGVLPPLPGFVPPWPNAVVL
jgi:hypothetical protein